ncbi:MAG: tetratricopeptide repeat protein [bacterium]|nr:tetratricopeptide repeat protein [bacterium]
MSKNPAVSSAFFIIPVLFIISLSSPFSGPVSAREDDAYFFYYASRLDCERSREHLGDITDPKSHYFALLELGKCYQLSGNYPESLIFLKKAYASNPALDSAPFLLAYAFSQVEDFANAKNWIRVARERKGPNSERSESLSRLINSRISSIPARKTAPDSGGESFTALTDRGKTVTFTNVKAGRMILKPEEEIKISNEPYQLTGARLTEASTINLRIGEFFGIGFVVPEIDFGDSVTLEYEFEIPSGSAGNGPADISKDQETYDQIFSRSTQYIYSLPPSENPGENPASGKCIQRLFSKGKFLVSHEFRFGK